MNSVDSLLTWPRLNQSEAEKIFLGLCNGDLPVINSSLARAEFLPVGQRVNQAEVEELRESVVEIASNYGFNRRHGFHQNKPESAEDTFRKFDRDLYWSFRESTNMPEAEAGSRSMWNWFALCLLPDITYWRWVFVKTRPGWDKERWLGIDLTRHTWGRQWWRSYRFQSNPELIESLNEKELVQLLERKDTIAANPRLLCALAEQYVAARDQSGLAREGLVIEVAKRVLREQTFINPLIFDDDELKAWIDCQIQDSIRSLVSTKARLF